MKNNYDIHINPPQPSSDAIQKHQDFDALFAQFQAAAPTQTSESDQNPQPESSNAASGGLGLGAKSAIIGTAAVAILATGIYLNRDTEPREGGEIAQTTESIQFQSPLPSDLEAATTNTSVPAEQGDTILYPSGSRLIVPPSAFVDANGQPVRGEVELRYREIGRGWQENNHAGTVELLGFYQNRPVLLANGKPLQLELRNSAPTSLEVKNLKIYAFDAVKGGWTYRAKDQVEVLPAKSGSSGENSSRAALEARYPMPTKPAKIRLADRNNPPFDVDFLPKEFPELAVYRSLLWESASEIADDLFARPWDDMNIVRKSDNLYELTLSNEAEKVVLSIRPVVLAQHLAEAEKVYAQQLADYEAKLKARQAKIDAELGQPKPEADAATNQLVHRIALDHFGTWVSAKDQPNTPK